jgi:hypothetical protein
MVYPAERLADLKVGRLEILERDEAIITIYAQHGPCCESRHGKFWVI